MQINQPCICNEVMSVYTYEYYGIRYGNNYIQYANKNSNKL